MGDVAGAKIAGKGTGRHGEGVPDGGGEVWQAFVRLVAEMRDAQKAYHHARTRVRLYKALDLERAVDARLLELVNGAFQAGLPLDPSGGAGETPARRGGE